MLKRGYRWPDRRLALAGPKASVGRTEGWRGAEMALARRETLFRLAFGRHESAMKNARARLERAATVSGRDSYQPQFTIVVDPSATNS
jgi:hypothetical protein